MASIHLDHVSVQFPIYTANTRSLKKSLMHATTGGRIGRNAGDRVCVQALDDVTLSFEHGDRVGLVGHNGAGKTTLLRVIAGIYEPPSGRVDVDGRVAALFDVALGIDPESTGYENIFLRGLYLGLRPMEIQARIDEITVFSELGDYLAMPVRTYSTGMLLRLSFAVDTSVEPDILIMDEVITAGDASFVKKATVRINSLIDKASIFVIASHVETVLSEFCNRAIWLDRGAVAADGTVDEVLAAYARARP